MPCTACANDPSPAPAGPHHGAIAAIEARLRQQLKPADAIASILIGRVAVHTERLDSLAVYHAAMTARRVRYARVDRENQRWAEVIATAHGLPQDPTQAVRRLRQTPEGCDWLIREWDLLVAEVDAGLHPAPKAVSVHDRARMFLGLHVVEQDGGAWAERCKAMVDASWDRKTDLERAHRDWVAAWAAEQAEGLRQERAGLDHAAEERDKSEAAARALFDPGPDAERMRRCEANADRFLLRTIRELERIQARAKAEAARGGRGPSPGHAPGAGEPIAENPPGTNEPTGNTPAATPAWAGGVSTNHCGV